MRPETKALGAVATLVVLLAALPAGPARAQASPGAGELEAAAARELETPPKKHQKRQGRPVRLGTSGGSVEDQTARFCCGGTLGALLEKDQGYFILSNNHVMARINNAREGEDITQPGLHDTGCAAPGSNVVGSLSGYQRLKFGARKKNKVDAAIAATHPSLVDPAGTIIGIGVPGNETVEPEVGVAVKKSGRTTGVTRGEVDSTNVSVPVDFPSECSDEAEILSARFVKTFFVISLDSKPFSDSGDSGSVIYEDVRNCPRAMGLLFAGSRVLTAGIKMSAVMKAVNKMKPKGAAELVGCSPGTSLAAGDAFAAGSGRAPATPDAPAERFAMRVQRRNENAMLELPGVVGMGIGRAAAAPEEVVFKVYVERSVPEILGPIPAVLEGVPVEVVESGRFMASYCPGEGPPGQPLGGLLQTAGSSRP